ncbi:MAG TPA: hypothetical protein VGQ00_03225 [Candidatus Norongarragalinales archaeon]|jgi:hypothetical protein|nr:hypothetical protein [Candidatus Norongarragalinales archaeon]
MSKFERFMREGNRKLVIKHLEKINKPAKIALALAHNNTAVKEKAALVLSRYGTEGARHLAASLHSHEFADVSAGIFGLWKMHRRGQGKHVNPYVKEISESILKIPENNLNFGLYPGIPYGGTIGTAADLLRRINDPTAIPALQKIREIPKGYTPNVREMINDAILELQMTKLGIPKKLIAPAREKRK